MGFEDTPKWENAIRTIRGEKGTQGVGAGSISIRKRAVGDGSREHGTQCTSVDPRHWPERAALALPPAAAAYS